MKQYEILGFRDFFNRKEEIKERYKKMNKYEKRLLKLHIYAMCFESEYIKDLMWEYLNGYIESYSELCIENRKRIRIEKKRWQKYANKDKYEIDELE